jgi:hypothetical protein
VCEELQPAGAERKRNARIRVGEERTERGEPIEQRGGGAGLDRRDDLPHVAPLAAGSIELEAVGWNRPVAAQEADVQVTSGALLGEQTREHRQARILRRLVADRPIVGKHELHGHVGSAQRAQDPEHQPTPARLPQLALGEEVAAVRSAEPEQVEALRVEALCARFALQSDLMDRSQEVSPDPPLLESAARAWVFSGGVSPARGGRGPPAG